MSINIGWLAMKESILGIPNHKISDHEYTFDLYDKLKTNVGLDAGWRKKFDEMRQINGTYSIVNCHISFLTDLARDKNHDFHVVFEVYNQSKLDNAKASRDSSD